MPLLEHPTSQPPKDKFPKSPDVPSEALAKEGFQQSHLANLEEEYQHTLTTYGSEARPKKERLLNDAFHTLSQIFTAHQDFPFSMREQAILKLKLARYLQREDSIDVNTLRDALLETPKFLKDATTKEIFDKAKELGLELCPPETGPELRLKDTEQSLYNGYCIAMESIIDRNGYPYVFDLVCHDSGLWLNGVWVGPESRLISAEKFVFRLPAQAGLSSPSHKATEGRGK